MGTITKASYEALAAECAEWHKRAVAAEAAITDHNTGCELSCGRRNEYNAKAFGCEAYLSRGMQCPDCPMDDLIEVPPALDREGEHGYD
jgi:hypothetical protein